MTVFMLNRRNIAPYETEIMKYESSLYEKLHGAHCTIEVTWK